MTADEIRLTDDELQAITGAKQAQKQLERLLADGFNRARIVAGKVVLERAHHDAVCRGTFGATVSQPEQRPRVRA